MARGGKRKGAGRRKVERPTDANVAGRVLAQAKAEKLWLSVIALERRRLGIAENGELLPLKKKRISGPDYQGNFSIIPLVNTLRYLEDRAFGRPVDTVNHLHDKPIEMNVTLSLADEIQKARERAKQKSAGRS